MVLSLSLRIAFASSVNPSAWNIGSPPEKVTLAKGSLMISFMMSAVDVMVPFLMSHDCGLWHSGQWLGQPAQ